MAGRDTTTQQNTAISVSVYIVIIIMFLVIFTFLITHVDDLFITIKICYIQLCY